MTRGDWVHLKFKCERCGKELGPHGICHPYDEMWIDVGTGKAVCIPCYRKFKKEKKPITVGEGDG